MPAFKFSFQDCDKHALSSGVFVQVAIIFLYTQEDDSQEQAEIIGHVTGSEQPKCCIVQFADGSKSRYAKRTDNRSHVCTSYTRVATAERWLKA